MTVASSPPRTRRERLRAETEREIEDHAFALLDASGAQSVTLAAIAKAMGMSAPALYRYFDSREALLVGLEAAARRELTSALADAAARAATRAAAARLREVAVAYRGWAVAHPKRYTMLFRERPADSSPAVSAAAQPLLDAVLDLFAYGARAGAQARRLAVLTWTRLHGIVALELAGVFEELGLEAGLLLDAEVGAAVQAASR